MRPVLLSTGLIKANNNAARISWFHIYKHLSQIKQSQSRHPRITHLLGTACKGAQMATLPSAGHRPANALPDARAEAMIADAGNASIVDLARCNQYFLRNVKSIVAVFNSLVYILWKGHINALPFPTLASGHSSVFSC